MNVTSKWKDHAVQDSIFIVTGRREALLRRPAVKALHILRYLHEVLSAPESERSEVSSIYESYPELLSGLGLTGTLYRRAFVSSLAP